MTDQEKLEAFIQEAVLSGWDGSDIGIKRELWLDDVFGEFYRDNTLRIWSEQPLEIIFNHDFAKALFGEEEEPVYLPHDVRSRDEGFVNDIYVPGNKHTSADLKRNLEENYKCRRCGKQLLSEYEVNNFKCEQSKMGSTNVGWEYHLQQMVISVDPIDYAYKVVFGEKE